MKAAIPPPAHVFTFIKPIPARYPRVLATLLAMVELGAEAQKASSHRDMTIDGIGAKTRSST